MKRNKNRIFENDKSSSLGQAYRQLAEEIVERVK